MNRLVTASRPVLVGWLVFRRWAASAGMRSAPFAAVIVVPAVVVGAALLAAALDREPEPRGVTVDIFLLAVCLVVFFTAWGYGIFGAHAGDATFREFRLLRIRPVGTAALRAGVRLPTALVGVVLAVALAPAAIVEITRSTGYGWLHAAVTLLLLVLSGTSMGRLSYAASGRINHLLHSPALRLTVAYLLCLAWAVGGIALFSWSLTSTQGGMESLYRVAFLVWPLAVWLVLTASPWAYAAAGAVTLALVLVAARRRPLGTESQTTALIRHPFDPARPLFAVRLLVRRMWRNPRGREWLLVGAFFSLMSIAAIGYATLETPMRVDLWAVRMLALLIGLSFGVLVRGLSKRHRPVEARWLIGPAAHVRAAFGAVLLLGVLVTVPVHVALWLDDPTPDRVAVHVATLVLQAAVAVTMSFLVVPRPGSGGMEFLGVMAYFGVSFAVGAALEQVEAAPVRVAATVAVAVLGLAAAVVVESGRRSRVGRPAYAVPVVSGRE